ncbi:chemotaxis protein CheW [Actinoplanes ianthinogenes]|uniref:Chemotaxis protein CheW n=1 Tax=Actinoplanes ianthinogenes TaxID=122358 RepID=A0ABM7M369_9ACTN|nr:chemotaxis protein CheW [Actinoplanes ianthinogenes]BCJ46020.1 chemotaxis protein CheW [Actinoplanes ianthinogenes]GGR25722.1 chemotaxis protein CheW [Actinoplanes ianthinogenes]
MSSRQFVTFEVADQFFGVDVDAVQEVLSYSEYTPVPMAPTAVGGLFNLRGQVIAAVDLRVQFGLPRRDMSGLVMNVIVRYAGEPVSLLVDRIGQVAYLDAKMFEEPPATLTGPSRALVTGAYKTEGRLLLVLDVAECVNTTRVPA